jgi:hypothetical protein
MLCSQWSTINLQPVSNPASRQPSSDPPPMSLDPLILLTGLEPEASLQLQQQLWDELTLGALLFALRWDGAVRVRRLAVQLLQRVALPLQGEAVGQLALLLADKCGDRDAQVRVGGAGDCCGWLLLHMPAGSAGAQATV